MRREQRVCVRTRGRGGGREDGWDNSENEGRKRDEGRRREERGEKRRKGENRISVSIEKSM